MGLILGFSQADRRWCSCGSQPKAEEMLLQIDHAFRCRQCRDKVIEVLSEASEIFIVYP